jgi:hypothetical protein
VSVYIRRFNGVLNISICIFFRPAWLVKVAPDVFVLRGGFIGFNLLN